MTEDAENKIKSQIIRVARVIPASPAEAYHAWTDPALKRQWWGKTDKAELALCEMDVRVGGRFRYGMRGAGQDAPDVASGEFLEIHPPHRMVFTWSIEGMNAIQDTRVTVEFTDLKDGTTRGVVTHEGLSMPQSRTIHQARWHNMLQDLTEHCAAS